MSATTRSTAPALRCCPLGEDLLDVPARGARSSTGTHPKGGRTSSIRADDAGLLCARSVPERALQKNPLGDWAGDWLPGPILR
ncbi:hypothetical protein IM697_43990 [Streptomyces ferrugineus]|uniref:Uncharacterized protein n=1 Tax=Streptomyces ferrugineus TaxID=1413221 RepID=A0A7M2SMY9_9ACTN|nr:hypothetical protein [Streptomyces ferrugineus]QOV36833.1 hypothetical protein IM697_43990 [Streptomyces ferrugineus]